MNNFISDDDVVGDGEDYAVSMVQLTPQSETLSSDHSVGLHLLVVALRKCCLSCYLNPFHLVSDITASLRK